MGVIGLKLLSVPPQLLCSREEDECKSCSYSITVSLHAMTDVSAIHLPVKNIGRLTKSEAQSSLLFHSKRQTSFSAHPTENNVMFDCELWLLVSDTFFKT